MTTPLAAAEPRINVNEVIGQNVHWLLWRKRGTQRALAAVLGVEPSVMSKKLRGTSAWSAQQVFTAAQFLDSSVAKLYEINTPTQPYLTRKLGASEDNPARNKPAERHLRAVPSL